MRVEARRTGTPAARRSWYISADGSTLGKYRYTPWGDTELADGGALTNNIRFAGRELDPERGPYYNRARYLVLEAGRS